MYANPFLGALLLTVFLSISTPADADLVLSFELGETRWSGSDRTLDFQIVGEAEAGDDSIWAIRIEPEGGQEPYRIAIDGELPAGIVFDSRVGVIRGSLAYPGISKVVIAVLDGAGSMVATELSIVVTMETVSPSI